MGRAMVRAVHGTRSADHSCSAPASDVVMPSGLALAGSTTAHWKNTSTPDSVGEAGIGNGIATVPVADVRNPIVVSGDTRSSQPPPSGAGNGPSADVVREKPPTSSANVTAGACASVIVKLVEPSATVPVLPIAGTSAPVPGQPVPYNAKLVDSYA